MAITVHEFYSYPNAQNEFLWPADRTTQAIASGATHTTNANVRGVVVTTDADTRMTIGVSGSAPPAAGAGDVPILSALENTYVFSEAAPQKILKFL